MVHLCFGYILCERCVCGNYCHEIENLSPLFIVNESEQEGVANNSEYSNEAENLQPLIAVNDNECGIPRGFEVNKFYSNLRLCIQPFTCGHYLCYSRCAGKIAQQLHACRLYSISIYDVTAIDSR